MSSPIFFFFAPCPFANCRLVLRWLNLNVVAGHSKKTDSIVGFIARATFLSKSAKHTPSHFSHVLRQVFSHTDHRRCSFALVCTSIFRPCTDISLYSLNKSSSKENRRQCRHNQRNTADKASSSPTNLSALPLVWCKSMREVHRGKQIKAFRFS